MLEDNGYEVVGQAANGEGSRGTDPQVPALMWCAWMSRCRVWTASPLPALSAMKTSPPSSCFTAFSPDRSGEEGHRRWRHGIRHQAVRGIKLLPTLEGGHGPFPPRSTICWTAWSAANVSSKETTDQLKGTEEKLKKAEDTL